MANAQHKNSIYVDSTGSVTVNAVNPRFKKIWITTTGAGAIFRIKETDNSGTIKVEFAAEGTYKRTSEGGPFGQYTSKRTYELDFGELGLDMTSTFYISAVTNCVAVILGEFHLKVV